MGVAEEATQVADGGARGKRLRPPNHHVPDEQRRHRSRWRGCRKRQWPYRTSYRVVWGLVAGSAPAQESDGGQCASTDPIPTTPPAPPRRPPGPKREPARGGGGRVQVGPVRTGRGTCLEGPLSDPGGGRRRLMRHRPGLCVGGRRREARPPLPTLGVSTASGAPGNRTNVQSPPIWGVGNFGYLGGCAIWRDRVRRCPARHPRGCLAPIPGSPRARTHGAPRTI